MNPPGHRRDEQSGRQLEGAMIVQSLVMAFTIAFIATAVLGHVLLLLISRTVWNGAERYCICKQAII